MVRPGACSGSGEAGCLSRRQMLRRGAALALAVPSAAALLEACSSASSSSSGAGSQAGSLAGTAHMENYPDWMGTHVVPAFQKVHPGSFVKQTTNSSSSLTRPVHQPKTANVHFRP